MEAFKIATTSVCFSETWRPLLSYLLISHFSLSNNVMEHRIYPKESFLQFFIIIQFALTTRIFTEEPVSNYNL